MPYARFVDGRFRGTTDEIIQWASLQVGVSTRGAAGGRHGRVLVAPVGGRRQRRFVRPLPGPAAIPLLGRVPDRARLDRVQRRLLRGDPARLLRRQDGMAEHRRARPRLSGRRPLGKRRRLVCGTVVDRSGEGSTSTTVRHRLRRAHLAQRRASERQRSRRPRSGGQGVDEVDELLRVAKRGAVAEQDQLRLERGQLARRAPVLGRVGGQVRLRLVQARESR